MTVLIVAFALASGLHGVVTRGPTTPVCKVGVPCSKPAPGAVIIFSREGRKPVNVHVGAGGRYSVDLPPGYYTVRLGTSPRIGVRIRPAHARVTPGVNARLNFSIDTGIR